LPLVVEILKAREEEYLRNGRSIIYGSFTLISYSATSLSTLLKNFYDWLDKFPNKEIRDLAIRKYGESIMKEYNPDIFKREKGSALDIGHSVL
jgi:hypothetical protein